MHLENKVKKISDKIKDKRKERRKFGSTIRHFFTI